MLNIVNSTEHANIIATMDFILPIVKYGLPYLESSSLTDFYQIIFVGIPTCNRNFRILAYLKKGIKPKIRYIKSVSTGNSHNEEANNGMKTLDCYKIIKYLCSTKPSIYAIDLKLVAWYPISPQVSQSIILHSPLLTPSPLCDRILHVGSKHTSSTKIVIIGAGIAGLAAAYKLTQAGVLDFRVLEAQSVAGGRISSTIFGEGNVELGAQWIHGSSSMFYQFVHKKRLLSSVISSEGEGHYLRKGGRRIPNTLVSEIKEVIEDILSRCEEFYSVPRNNAPSSVGEYLNIEFEHYLQTCDYDSPDTLRLKRELFDWHLRFQIIDNSCYNLEDLCAFDWGRFQSCGSENFNIKHNYFQIVERLLAELPNNSVEYKRLVCSVDWNNNMRVLTSCTAALHQYLAEHLIVTCSVGVINAFPLSFFSPQLPDAYVKGYRSIGFGTINKIFLHYEEAWWQDMKGIQLVWDSIKDKLPVDQELDMAWTRGVTGFDLVAGLPEVLLCWVGGIGAELVEQLPDEIVAEHCTVLLTLFTGITIPHPTQILRSKWNSNKQVRGSYSYSRAVGDQAKTNLSAQLLTPIYMEKNGKKVPSILFAGEALHEKHYSTVHGAFETGIIQANKLIEFLKTN